MQLSDLKTGMIVTWRNGVECVVMIDYEAKHCTKGRIFVNAKEKKWLPFGYYGEDMKIIRDREDFGSDDVEFDVVKVEIANHPYGFLDLEYERDNRKLLWQEEPEIKEVTMSEVEEKFGCKVKIVGG